MIDTTKLKRMWRKGQKQCSWCGYSVFAQIHGSCVPLPDYHDANAYFDWMFNKERPTKHGRKERLSAGEQVEYNKWKEENERRREKEDDIMYD